MQKALAPNASFNFKLENNELNILEIGTSTDYFAADEYTEYQNQGKNVWALNVLSFKLGDAEITSDKQSPDDA